MIPRTDRATRYVAPASAIVALVIGFAPVGRARAEIPVRSWQDLARERRGCASGSWLSAGPVRVDALLSRSKLLRDSEGEVFLDLKLRAVSRADDARPPVDLALAIDVSGAMAGAEKLRLLTQTCLGLAAQLGPDDRIAVVTFADEASTVVSLDGRRSEPLVSAGGSDLGKGLEAAAAELERAARPGAARRLLIVTDGRPDRGVTSTDDLASLVAGLAGEGISVSALGLGLGYDDALLSALADAGGGAYHHVETSERVAGIFDAELKSLRAVVAKSVRVRLEPAPGVELAEIVGWSAVRDGDALSVLVGDFAAGRTAKVVARLKVPTTARTNIADVVRVSVEAVDARSEHRVKPPVAELAAVLTSRPEEAVACDLSTLTTSVLGSGAKQGYAFSTAPSSATSEFLWFAMANPQTGASGDRYFETNAAGVIYYTTNGNLLLDTATCDLTVIANSQSVYREGDKERDGRLDYRVRELQQDLADAQVARDLDRARSCTARGDRSGAREALESVKRSRATLEYTAADGKLEKLSVDELETDLTRASPEARARAEKFVRAIPVGK